MKRKDRTGILQMPESHTVRVAERLKLIKVPSLCFLLTSLFTEEKNATNHLPQDCGEQDLFYHQLANQGLQPIQVRQLIIVNIVPVSTLAIMVKHDKLMMAHDCDFIKMVSDIKDRDGGEFPVTGSLNFPQNGQTGSLELTRLRTRRGTGE